MIPSYRALSRLLAAISAVGLFLLISANPLAQSGKLPAPASHVSDFAGVIDAQTKTRLESLLQKLKEKSKIELYVATIDTTGAQELSAFSQQLARDWNIGAKTTRSKSLLLVVAVSSKTSFTQTSRTAQTDLPDGVLGEMSYRMHGPLDEGRFAEAIDSGVRVFATALAEKIGFNVADLEPPTVATNATDVAADSPQPVLVSAATTRVRKVSDVPPPTPQATPPEETPRTDPTPTETPAAEPTPSESSKAGAAPAESPKTEPATVESPDRETSNSTRTKPASAAKSSPPTAARSRRRRWLTDRLHSTIFLGSGARRTPAKRCGHFRFPTATTMTSGSVRATAT